MNTCNNPLSLCRDDNPNKNLEDFKSNREKFWFYDPRELYRNYYKIWPVYETTRSAQCNALTRLFIYMILLVLLFNKFDVWLLIPVVGILIIIILFLVHSSDYNGKRKEFERILRIRQEQRDQNMRDLEYEKQMDGVKKFELDTDNKFYMAADNVKDIEVGQIDSNGNIIIQGALNIPKSISQQHNLYTVDEMIDLQKNTCKRPTIDN